MIPPVIRDSSLQAQGPNTAGTPAPSSTSTPSPEKHLTPKPPLISPEASSIFSEEAKSKFEKDVQTLKFVRKVHALGEDTTRKARVDELKEQFKTTEGLNDYLNTLDTDTIAKNLINHNVL
jgi:hypothetical protein